MTAVISLYGTQATLNGRVWACSNPTILRALQVVTSPEDIPVSLPDPEAALAEHVAQVFGGYLVSSQEPTAKDIIAEHKKHLEESRIVINATRERTAEAKKEIAAILEQLRITPK